MTKYIYPLRTQGQSFSLLNVATTRVPWLSEKESDIFVLDSYAELGNQSMKKFICMLVDYATYIHLELEKHHAVVVCCKNGRSRSPNVMVAFLILYRGFTYAAAVAWLTNAFRAQRPHISSVSVSFPNWIKFHNVLTQLETYRNQQSVVLMERLEFLSSKRIFAPGAGRGGGLKETVAHSFKNFIDATSEWHRPAETSRWGRGSSMLHAAAYFSFSKFLEESASLNDGKRTRRKRGVRRKRPYEDTLDKEDQERNEREKDGKRRKVGKGGGGASQTKGGFGRALSPPSDRSQRLCESNTNHDGMISFCKRPATVGIESAQPLCGRECCQPGFVRNGKMKPDISLVVDNIVQAFQRSSKYFILLIWEDSNMIAAVRSSVEQNTGFGSTNHSCECDMSDCVTCKNIIPREDSLVIACKHRQDGPLEKSVFSVGLPKILEFARKKLSRDRGRLMDTEGGNNLTPPHLRIVYDDCFLDDFVMYITEPWNHSDYTAAQKKRLRNWKEPFQEMDLLKGAGWTYSETGVLQYDEKDATKLGFWLPGLREGDSMGTDLEDDTEDLDLLERARAQLNPGLYFFIMDGDRQRFGEVVRVKYGIQKVKVRYPKDDIFLVENIPFLDFYKRLLDFCDKDGNTKAPGQADSTPWTFLRTYVFDTRNEKRVGLTFSYSEEDGQMLVDEVIQGGQASEKSLIAKGDVLFAINNEKIEGLAFTELSKRLCQQGSKKTLTFSKNWSIGVDNDVV